MHPAEALVHSIQIIAQLAISAGGTSMDSHANLVVSDVNPTQPNTLYLPGGYPNPTEWQCTSEPGTKEIASTKCTLVYDEKGAPSINLTVQINDPRPGPYTSFTPINAARADGFGLGLFFYSPAGKNGGDSACADPTRSGDNYIRFGLSFRAENAIPGIDAPISDECFAKFKNPLTVTMLGSDGKEHLVTFKIDGSSKTGIFPYWINEKGETILNIGTNTNPLLVTLDDFIRSDYGHDQARGAAGLLLTDVKNPNYPNIQISQHLIDLFPTLLPPVVETTETVTPEKTPIPGTLTTPTIPDNTETVVIPPEYATPRLPGIHKTIYEINCPAGDNWQVLKLSPANEDVISMVSLNLQGWSVEQIQARLNSINDHSSSWSKFASKLPSFLKKLFGIKNYPHPPVIESCKDSDLVTQVEPIIEIITDGGNTLQILGLDPSGNLLLLTIDNKQASKYITPVVTVANTLDEAMTKESQNQLHVLGKNPATNFSTPALGSVAAPASVMMTLPKSATMEDLKYFARLELIPITNASIISENGSVISTPFIPSGIPFKIVGSRQLPDGNRVIIGSMNISDLPPETPQSFIDLLKTAYPSGTGGRISIQVPAEEIWTAATKDQVQPTPTPISYQIPDTTPRINRPEYLVAMDESAYQPNRKARRALLKHIAFQKL